MIIVQLSGAMGNQMFQYALGRHLSLKYNTQLKFDHTILEDRTVWSKDVKALFREYQLDAFVCLSERAERADIPIVHRSYFSGKPKLFFNMVRHRFLPNRGKEKKSGVFQPEVLLIGENAYLDGFWQSEKYFSEIADMLRKDFTFKRPFGDKTETLLNEIKNKKSVCIHVRRTDYVDNPFHRTLGQEYYDKGIAYITERVLVEKIYVFSDDIDWCKENLSFSIDTCFVGAEYSGKKDEENMALMSACTHFVIPNSSFSWWAAWLSQNPDKIVVAPKTWFFDASLEKDDVVPDRWIRM